MNNAQYPRFSHRRLTGDLRVRPVPVFRAPSAHRLKAPGPIVIAVFGIPRHDTWDCHRTADQARGGLRGQLIGIYGSPMECLELPSSPNESANTQWMARFVDVSSEVYDLPRVSHRRSHRSTTVRPGLGDQISPTHDSSNSWTLQGVSWLDYPTLPRMASRRGTP